MSESHTFLRYQPIVDDWTKFTQSLKTPLPVCCWTNQLRTERDELFQLFANVGWAAQRMEWNSHGLRLPANTPLSSFWGHFAGMFYIQEEASMIPVQLLAPQPCERILDMCAAPGGNAHPDILSANTR